MVYKFFSFPDEVALNVYKYLPPAQLRIIKSYLDTDKSLKNVNKSLPFDKVLWEQKFAYHFPQKYECLKSQYSDKITLHSLDWEQLFGWQNQAEYADLPDHLPELFALVKEGQLEALKEKNLVKNLTYNDIMEYKCINELSLLQWALKKDHQHIVDYFYQIISVKLAESPEYMKMALRLAVYCRQPVDVVSSLSITENTLNLADDSGWVPLDYAIDNSDIAVVNFLLSNGADIQNEGYTTLLSAIACNCAEIVRIILEKWAVVYQADASCLYTPLQTAVKAGNSEIVKLLVAHGASIEQVNQNNEIPLLRLAIENGYSAIVKILLGQGAKIDTVSSDLPMLHLAASKGCDEIIEMLIDNGAEVDQIFADNQQTALHYAANAGKLESVKVLLKHGAQVNLVDSNDDTPLYRAVKNGYFDVSKVLLNHGAQVKCLDNASENALHGAMRSLCDSVNLELVKLLLSQDPNSLNQPNESGETPLYLAIENGHSAIVKFLLEQGAKIDPVSSVLPMLHLAASKSGAEIIEILIKHGAQVNLTDAEGHPPLYFAAQQGNCDIVKVLLNHGAQVKCLDNASENALHVAMRFLCDSGNLELVKLLLSQDPNLLNQPNEFRETPLHLAVKYADLENSTEMLAVIKWLVEQNVNLNEQNNYGDTPLDELSSDLYGTAIETFLIEKGALMSAELTQRYRI